jgi:protein O-mannosyl-transferase
VNADTVLCGGRQVLFRLGVPLVLAAAVFITYFGALRADFITCDDPDYVVNNAEVQSGLTTPGLRWALTTSHANNWHPLTWMSHMLDCQIYGMKPMGHHLTSVLLHTFNTALVFMMLWQLTRAMWRSALVAGLFGLHPMHVESVAWISERKDVLSTFFFLLTIWSYARYAKFRIQNSEFRMREGTPISPTKAWFCYGLGLLLFALGLMSKPMVVSLPFVLLLLDFWPLQRLALPLASSPIRPSRLVAEKVPFVVLAAAASVITLRVQSNEGNMATIEALPPDLRLANAAISYVRYLGKLVWPTKLAAHYPYNNHPAAEQVVFAALVLLFLTVAALRLLKSKPYTMVGWLFFVGTLLPVIGLVQVGTQSMADRYSYIPYIGLFLIAAWGLGDFARLGLTNLRLSVAASAVVLAACAVLSARQVALWKNTETLFTHSLSVVPNDSNAQANLGAALMMKGKYDEAAVHVREALAINPNYPEAKSNLGFILAMQGKYDEAISWCRAALRLRPSLAQTHYLLGMALLATGERQEAVTEYRSCLAINANHTLSCNDLAWVLSTDPNEKLRNGLEAVSLGERACRLTGYKDAQFVGTLAAAYAEAGRFDEAIKTAQRAKTIAEQTGETELVKKNEELLRLYRARQPYRDTSTR